MADLWGQQVLEALADVDLSDPVNWSHPLAHGLIALWFPIHTHYGGQVIPDLSAMRDHGRLHNNPTWSAIEGRLCLRYDGTDDYVESPSKPWLQFSTGDEITVYAWVRLRANVTGQPAVVGKGRIGTSSLLNYRLRISSTSPGNVLSFLYRNSADSAWHRWESNTGIEIKKWFFVAFSYRFGDGSSARGYINGRPVSGGWNLGSGNEAPHVGSEPVWLGSRVTHGSGYTFDGHIGDVGIYRRILPDQEVAALFMETKGRYSFLRRRKIWYPSAAVPKKPMIIVRRRRRM